MTPQPIGSKPIREAGATATAKTTLRPTASQPIPEAGATGAASKTVQPSARKTDKEAGATPPAKATIEPTDAITIGGAGATLTVTAGTQRTVRVGDASFTVEVADKPELRYQGLSGRPALPAGTGMLFVFQREGTHTFWMKDMRFPLDMMWIDAACTVVHVTRNVPPPEPGQALSDLPTYGPTTSVLYVLEINAGAAGLAGVRLGDPVRFIGGLAGKYGC